MGKSFRDERVQGQVIDVIEQEDGCFHIFLNRELQNGNFTEEQLAYELCTRFGYCQDEFHPIRESLKQTGRAQLRP